MKLVLVDHNALALTQLTAQFRSLGCQNVVSCGSGLEAVQAVGRDPERVGLVVCDLEMPGMDGAEVLRHLAGVGFKGRIAVTSAEDDRLRQRALALAQAHRLNLVAALRKPLSLDMLSAALRAGPIPNRRAPDGSVHPSPEQLWSAMQRGELLNVYQPVIGVQSGRLVGVEALVRWQHPTEGLLLPEAFLGVAEAHGLIDALASVVVRNACEQSARWRSAGLDLSMALNVSVNNLVDPYFPDMVEDTAHAHQVPLASITLELTDSGWGSPPLTWEFPTRLRQSQVRFALDNFGTGQFPLAQLRDYPFDELKIDGCFVQGVSRSAGLRAVFEAGCEMAHHIGMGAVATGVEDALDWEFVRRSGCDRAQGYFISRPLPGDAVPAWAASWDGPG